MQTTVCAAPHSKTGDIAPEFAALIAFYTHFPEDANGFLALDTNGGYAPTPPALLRLVHAKYPGIVQWSAAKQRRATVEMTRYKRKHPDEPTDDIPEYDGISVCVTKRTSASTVEVQVGSAGVWYPDWHSTEEGRYRLSLRNGHWIVTHADYVAAG
jgi:hypothetical protein